MEVGELIRHWRTTRRLSQQALADEAQVSPRHLSCVETGRARPSREMVLVLASALDVPLRERNTLLLAAGFAPVYRDTDLGAPAMAQVRRALDHLLAGAEPYGAIVVNREWDLVRANRPWQILADRVVGRPVRPGENVLELTLHPDGFRRAMRNADAVARHLLQRLHREAVATGDAELHARLEGFERLPGIPVDWRREALEQAPAVAETIDLCVDGVALSLFTTLTTLGTPADVGASELRIEHYFPADAATEAILRGAGGAG